MWRSWSGLIAHMWMWSRVRRGGSQGEGLKGRQKTEEMDGWKVHQRQREHKKYKDQESGVGGGKKEGKTDERT